MSGRLASLDAVRGFIDGLACPVVVTRGPLIVAVNDAWLNVIGFPRDRVEGHPYMEFVPPEERTRIARGVELRAQGVRRPMRLTSLALKADGTSTIVHVEPTVVPAAGGDPFIVNFVFVVPERDHEIELAELLVAVSSRLASARAVPDVRQATAAGLGEAGYVAGFFRLDGAALFPEGAELPPDVQPADLDEASTEDRPVFVGPQSAVPSAVIVPVRRGESELLVIAGPRLATPLRSALKLFAQGVASALDTVEARAELVRRERLAALGEMAATLAHEVRNPVAVISNAVTTLRRDTDGESKTLELLAIIDEECCGLAEMIQDLLDFAKPRPMNLMFETLSDIAEEAIAAASTQPDPAVTSVRFHLERAPNVPEVRVDRQLLRQALVNLLINAAQASPDGAEVRVKVGLTERGGKQVPSIAVVDQGGGIEESLTERIFEPFFTTRPRGTGLGLAVVRRIVDQLSGKIDVAASPGRGATFRLTFDG